MEIVVLYTMTKDESVKYVYAEEVRQELEAMGWVVEGGEAPARRGRKPKVEE